MSVDQQFVDYHFVDQHYVDKFLIACHYLSDVPIVGVWKLDRLLEITLRIHGQRKLSWELSKVDMVLSAILILNVNKKCLNKKALIAGAS